jgi:hypothetical protein
MSRKAERKEAQAKAAEMNNALIAEMKRETLENPRFAKARVGTLVIGAIWLVIILLDRLLALYYSAAGTEIGVTSSGPALMVSIFLPALIFMDVYRRNNIVLLIGFMCLSGSGTIAIGMMHSDWFSVVLGICFLVFALLLFVIPLFKQYRLRTKEIMDAYSHRKKAVGRKGKTTGGAEAQPPDGGDKPNA